MTAPQSGVPFTLASRADQIARLPPWFGSRANASRVMVEAIGRPGMSRGRWRPPGSARVARTAPLPESTSIRLGSVRAVVCEAGTSSMNQPSTTGNMLDAPFA